jgi:hypothetical protein
MGDRHGAVDPDRRSGCRQGIDAGVAFAWRALVAINSTSTPRARARTSASTIPAPVVRL